jgi:hypothetical protein
VRFLVVVFSSCRHVKDACSVSLDDVSRDILKLQADLKSQQRKLIIVDPCSCIERN